MAGSGTTQSNSIAPPENLIIMIHDTFWDLYWAETWVLEIEEIIYLVQKWFRHSANKLDPLFFLLMKLTPILPVMPVSIGAAFSTVSMIKEWLHN